MTPLLIQEGRRAERRGAYPHAGLVVLGGLSPAMVVIWGSLALKMKSVKPQSAPPRRQTPPLLD